MVRGIEESFCCPMLQKHRAAERPNYRNSFCCGGISLP
jgi:hypothetical protein